MEARTKPRTVQLMVICDPEDVDWVSRQLRGFFHANKYDVIDCTTDYPAKDNPKRRKFHVTAIPAKRSSDGRRVCDSSSKTD